jgi:hypothetical protein
MLNATSLTAPYADWFTLLHSMYHSLRAILDPESHPIDEIHLAQALSFTELLRDLSNPNHAGEPSLAAFSATTDYPRPTPISDLDLRKCFERSESFKSRAKPSAPSISDAISQVLDGAERTLQNYRKDISQTPSVELAVLNDVLEALLAQLQSYLNQEYHRELC